MRRLDRRATLAGLLALAACGPKIELAGSGLTLPVRFGESQTPANWPSPDWWRGFGSPELDALMQKANTGNFDIAQAIARIRQADAQLRISGASLLPTVSVGADNSRSRSSTSGRAYTTSTHSVTASASYEIDFWGKNRSTAESAQQSLRYAQYDAETVRLTQLASVANTYFEVLEAEAELVVQRQNLAAARRILTVLRAQLAGGTATSLDVFQQETTVAQTDAQIPVLEQTASQGRNTLAVLLGEAPENIMITGGSFDSLLVPHASPGQPSELIARRPDVQAAEAQLAAANANVAVARANLLPSVTLSAEAGWSAAALSSLFTPAASLWSLAASVTQTVFDGGALRGQVELSKAEAEELLYAYRSAIMTALKEVENAIIGLRQSEEQERRLRIAIDRAERAYSVAESQLRGGTVTLTTVLQTQQTLFSARISLVQARLTTFEAAVTLFKVLGGGWH
ncbi:outer membrane protein OprM precursor [Roseomonas sp. TAS13]|uniref:efflux transporter outer membrane subunit n=1 Tax=Roseomonas sp. TAS13 TaxID=1926319 RepID=UPI000960B881|nr:efflux transporter outer membrane subunit [Roseomonas sp. TAS13]USQ74205.1 efflux transporter outer membrane subunit [Roseomonas mucosa]GAV34588.1 outer membrane protein OprM precursor [Roseomonas sp. TAS13]